MASSGPDPEEMKARYRQLGNLEEDVDLVGIALMRKYGGGMEDFQNYTPRFEDPTDDFIVAQPDPEPDNVTFGFSIEFAMATCRGRNQAADPHQYDTRWLPHYLGAHAYRPNGIRFLDKDDEKRWRLWVREHIYEAHQVTGVHISRRNNDPLWPGHEKEDVSKFFSRRTFGLLEGAEFRLYQRAFLQPSLGFGAVWNHVLTADQNKNNARNVILYDFESYCTGQNILPQWVTPETDNWLAENLIKPGYNFLRGGWPYDRQEFSNEMKGQFVEAARAFRERLDLATDTNLLQPKVVPDMDDKHRYYTIGRSDDILVDYLRDTDYGEEKKKINLVRRYKWFPGKIKTPVRHDYTDPDSYRIAEGACLILRTMYRIHKPLSSIGGTVCVHIGANYHWTLRQLKRFVTVWLFIEPFLPHLFRKERGSSYTARPLMQFSRIGRYLEILRSYRNMPYPYDNEELYRLEWFRNRVYSEERFDDMRLHVPIVFPETHRLKDLLYEIWQYRSINALREGLGDCNQLDDHENQGDMALYIGMHGWKRTNDRAWDWNPQTRDQTISIRLMQSTLNPRHIAAWLRILNTIAEYARNATLDTYSDCLKYIWRGEGDIEDRIGLAMGCGIAMNYCVQHMHPRGVGDRQYLEYPDEDVADWDNPFTVEGFGSDFWVVDQNEPDWDVDGQMFAADP
ncbi:hypothetical protein F4810DRAFT_715349 [Camillea tinctor]|nr:hypothetical protein F4810DRAFT_715349 [Camillea tinctor]